jgi:hypothetical protein
LVFDEGKESAYIATNENILLLDEYSKVKLLIFMQMVWDQVFTTHANPSPGKNVYDINSK